MDKLTATNISNYLEDRKSKKESDRSSSKIFKINYKDAEKDVLKNIKIKKDIEDDYKYCGLYVDKLPNVTEFLEKVTDNTDGENTNLSKIIDRLVKKIVKGYNKKYIWISLRASYYNNYFDTPNWHIDGRYHPSDYELSKFVTVLLGEGTLIKEATDKSKEIFFETDAELTEQSKGKSMEEQRDIQKTFRKKFDDNLKDVKTIQLKNDEGLIFFSGYDNKNSQIHSEPKMDKPRLFLSIFAMDENGYENLKNRSQCKSMTGGYYNKYVKYQSKCNRYK